MAVARAAHGFLYTGANGIAAGAAAGARAVLFLVPVTAPEAAADVASAAAAGVVDTLHVPVDVSAGLSLATADACVSALARLPRPTHVLCASGNRASAVIAIAVGREERWSGEATLAWALDQKMPFLTVQVLRDWVVASVDVRRARARARASRAARSLRRGPYAHSPPPHPSSPAATAARARALRRLCLPAAL